MWDLVRGSSEFIYVDREGSRDYGWSDVDLSILIAEVPGLPRVGDIKGALNGYKRRNGEWVTVGMIDTFLLLNVRLSVLVTFGLDLNAVSTAGDVSMEVERRSTKDDTGSMSRVGRDSPKCRKKSRLYISPGVVENGRRGAFALRSVQEGQDGRRVCRCNTKV